MTEKPFRSFTSLQERLEGKSLNAVALGPLNDSIEAAIERARAKKILSSVTTVDQLENTNLDEAAFVIGSGKEIGQLLRHGLLETLQAKSWQHIGIAEIPGYAKLLGLTDAFATTVFDLKSKLALLQQAIACYHRLGLVSPKVAVLAAVEVVYPQMVATTDGAVLAKMAERGQVQGADIDGPLSFDIAIDSEAAKGKGITSSIVAGEADLLLAPDAATANGIYKALALMVKATIGGVLTGGVKPVAVNLPADTSDNIYSSILLAAALS